MTRRAPTSLGKWGKRHGRFRRRHRSGNMNAGQGMSTTCPGCRECGVAWLLSRLFFFSSRRRHTRFDCDWSSDVCSSDLSTCDEIGLNMWAALKLYEDGWLSFCPESTPRLDEAQEAELRFVGSLVQAGCDRPMLTMLLGSLPKPYAYRPGRLYYDWTVRHWRLLPEPHPHPQAIF